MKHSKKNKKNDKNKNKTKQKHVYPHETDLGLKDEIHDRSRGAPGPDETGSPAVCRSPASFLSLNRRLVGLVERRPPESGRPRIDSCFRRGDFSTASHTSGFKLVLQRRSLRRLALQGQPGVSILWLGETATLICKFYLSVVACTIV